MKNALVGGGKDGVRAARDDSRAGRLSCQVKPVKLILQLTLPMLLTLTLLANAPAVARSGSHGHHHGGSHRSHYSTLPATTPRSHYCESTKRRVLDVRDCPEATLKPPTETPVADAGHDNR